MEAANLGRIWFSYGFARVTPSSQNPTRGLGLGWTLDSGVARSSPSHSVNQGQRWLYGVYGRDRCKYDVN